MAIAYDNSVTAQHVTPVTATMTISASATMALCAVMNGNGSWTVDTMTLNGVAMTALTNYKITSGSLNNWKVYIYYLANPSTGSQTFSCSSSSASGGIYIVAGTWTGTGSTVEAFHQDSNTSGSTLTNTVTTLTNNAWCMSFASSDDNGGGKPTANSGCTLRKLEAVDNVMGLFDSNGAITPAGSKSFVYNINGTHGGRGVIMSIPPLASGPTNVKTWDGISLSSVKTIDDIAIASIKSIDGVT